ncbi:MAG: hypothetical protein CM1200mP36_04920 [Gammaproteobacteria bacterium]|nr:MAG: hypothetical protein CM1200mP36_04920 [Gammaproteobacteria bacterium]
MRACGRRRGASATAGWTARDVGIHRTWCGGHCVGELEIVGPRSVGVPGAPGGYSELASLGRRSLAELAAPAIELAKKGPVWTPIAQQLTREAETAPLPYNGSIGYLPGDQVPEVGKRLPLPGLAAVIGDFVREGPRLFSGALGDRLRDRLGENCLLGGDDLRKGTALWCQPACIELADARLMATPAPTHGPGLLEAFRLARRAPHPETQFCRHLHGLIVARRSSRPPTLKETRLSWFTQKVFPIMVPELLLRSLIWCSIIDRVGDST